MTEVETLLADQKVTAVYIENFINNTKKSKSAKSFKASDYEGRLELLDEYWQSFGQKNVVLARKSDALKERSYFASDVYGKTRENYLEAKAWLRDQLGDLRAADLPAAANVSFVGHSAQYDPSLEKCKLPRFDGKQRDWETFKERFMSLVYNNTTQSTIMKFQRLHECLDGDAAKKLKGFQLTSANFQTAWDSLCSRYDNKFVRHTLQMQTLIRLPSALEDKETVSHINELLNTTNESINTFGALDRPTDHWDDFFVHFVVSKLASQTRYDWQKEVEKKQSQNFPKYPELRTFLEARIRTLDIVEVDQNFGELTDSNKIGKGNQKASNSSEDNKPKSNKKTRNASINVTSQNTGKEYNSNQNSKCSYCSGNHFVGFCNAFNSAPQAQKLKHVESAKLCRNCLNRGHYADTCRSKGKCWVCQEKHHTKLHQDSKTGSSSQPSVSREEKPRRNISECHAASNGNSSALLTTACILLQSADGSQVTIRALLDTGAEESLISSNVVQALSLKRKPVHVVINGVGGLKSLNVDSEVDVTLKSLHASKFSFKFSALVVDNPTSALPRIKVAQQEWPHLSDLTLADPHYGQPAAIDCILDASVVAAILRPGIRRGPRCSPTAIHTALGWVLLGRTQQLGDQSSSTQSAYQTSVDQDLTKLISRFWELEEIPVKTRFSTLEEECYNHFKETHFRDNSGRFVVRLPFVKHPSFSNTRSTAAACLARMEVRLRKQPDLEKAYSAFIEEYKALQHLESVPSSELERKDAFYLPHHAVFKKDGSNKIRVVFNASQTDSMGMSLNTFLHTGPKLQEDIVVILIRWSFLQYVFTCDVVKMFRQFLVHPDDVDWQRILWRNSTDSSIETLRLITVTYGTACAPFLANACMLQLADDGQKKLPLASEVLRKNRYTDDFFAGGDTLEEAEENRDQLITILATAGMSVGKWAANQISLLRDLGVQASEVTDLEVQMEETVSTLGLHWSPKEDCFRFKISDLSAESDKVTKRSILSEIAKLFDPVGWLSPIIIRAKMFVQNLWMQGADWDAPVSTSMKLSWLNFRSQLKEVESIRIPRWFGVSSRAEWELHGFCDASERAYAAVLYVVGRLVGQTTSKIITAKSKVAPIKVISLPKLELSGAQLLAKLISSLLPKLSVQPSRIFCWSDSEVVLAWLQGHPSRWKPFVANRVSEIVSLIPQSNWNHVRSAHNPADCATRGFTPQQLKDSELWWNGPEWLRLEESDWPNKSVSECLSDSERMTDSECRKNLRNVCIVQDGDAFSTWCSKFSSIQKIIRILAYVYRWYANSKLAPEDRRKTWVSADEREKGRLYLLRGLQQEEFASEFASLRKKNIVSSNSPTRRLLPFIDTLGVLRVGGRLQNSFLTESEKHPIVLPSKHHVTNLIIAEAHLDTLHGGSMLVHSYLCRQYWIIRGRNLIRKIVRMCVKCTRFNAITQEQQMGALPADRVIPSRPFTFTGVDYAGPFLIKASPGRGQKCYKGYVAIFVCMVVKAVHIEIVSDYSSFAFLAAFKRFSARRGLCKVMYSDNGTTFQGADRELQRLFSATSAMSQEVASAIAKKGVTWTYIPPRGPNFGGLWETNVKSFKSHLKRIIGVTKLTYEELSTVACQIESILNSRPLCPISCDSEALVALTPDHFISGRPTSSPPEPFTEINEPNTVCSRWHLTTLMRNHFWLRWRQEFLTQLQHRSKWLKPNHNFKVGDLVLFKDELLPAANWPLARITRLYPGRDGLSRVVHIKTQGGEYKRPVNKLILLPVNEEASANVAVVRRLMVGGEPNSTPESVMSGSVVQETFTEEKC